MRAIFMDHPSTLQAQEELHARRTWCAPAAASACSAWRPADRAHCHRSMVADAQAELVPVEIAT